HHDRQKPFFMTLNACLVVSGTYNILENAWTFNHKEECLTVVENYVEDINENDALTPEVAGF
ncbi:unnamed protein product, partial [Sphenostylis stenocarpa]